MKKSIFTLFFYLAFLALRAQDFERIEACKLAPLDIECSITCEDAALDFFEISWRVPLIDSIARAEGLLPRTELHCFVYDSSGIIGFYKGLSTPMQYCSFQTKDSLVEVFFRVKRIPYDAYPQDSIGRIVSIETDPFTQSSHRGPEFESVHLPVHSTTNRKLTLLNDTNTVVVSYGIRPGIDPYGQPQLGLSYSTVISLDRYYVSLKTGQIATGQKWIDRKGPKKIVRKSDQFILVSPSTRYVDENNNPYSGAELIHTRKIKLNKFELEDFVNADKDNYPY